MTGKLSRKSLAMGLGASMLAALIFAAAALADSSNPTGITATSNTTSSGTTVTLSGTWAWTASACDAGKAVGFAIDWNDPNQPGNAVAGGFDAGTPTDNLVHPANGASFVACTGSSGTWGPISHTYAPGTTTTTACVIMYDVHFAKDGTIPTTGSHSTQAGGTGHNSDNSIESNAFTPSEGGNSCLSSAVAAVTLRSVTAKRSAKGVTVNWRTASEVDVAGYNVYGLVHGKRVKLSSRIIASKGAGANSYAFRYRTPKGQPAPTQLWLQSINLDGSRQWHAARVIREGSPRGLRRRNEQASPVRQAGRGTLWRRYVRSVEEVRESARARVA